MSELHLYDFDGTLFRSPMPPAVWDEDWWSDTRSLTPPCIPENPGSDWWISSTVQEAKRSIANPDAWAVMMTGRNERTGLRMVIPQLLRGAGLSFDEVHLTPPGSSIAEKKKKLFRILRKYPHIETLRIWDDRPSHLRDFKKLGEKLGLEVHTNLVRSRSQEALCEGGVESAGLPKKVSYVGIFLDSRSQAALQKEFGFEHGKIKNEHITLALRKPSAELLGMVGQTVSGIRVVGYAEDDIGQAVVVDLPPGIPYEKRGLPHVTLSHDESVGPAYSNDLIAKGDIRPVSGITISGVIDTDPRSLRPRMASAVRVARRYSRK